MRISHRGKQFAAVRVAQSTTSRQRAGDDFRKRHVDAALQRALKAVVKADGRP